MRNAYTTRQESKERSECLVLSLPPSTTQPKLVIYITWASQSSGTYPDGDQDDVSFLIRFSLLLRSRRFTLFVIPVSSAATLR